jgi:hypothetical protein
MNPLRSLLFGALLWGASIAAGQNRVEVRNAWPALVYPDCPVGIAFTREDPPRGIIALQRGTIHVLPGDRSSLNSPVFLDFRPQLKEEIHFEAGFNPVLIAPDATGEPLVLNHRGWIGELVEGEGMGR